MLDEDQQVRFTRLWTSAQPSVGRYVASLIGDPWAAADVMQETSITLLRKFSEFDESRPFLAWALGIAKFEILSHRRDVARSRLVHDSDLLDQYTEAWASIEPRVSDDAEALRRCVGELKGQSRRIIELRYSGGRTSADIAVELQLTAANVRAILKRTRDILEKCVKRQQARLGGSA